MKKKNTLLAKILVVVILLITMSLGVLKLIDYLEKPKTLFYSVIEDVYSDFGKMMSRVANDDAYVLLSNSSVKIDSDTKVSMSGLNLSSYAKYQSIINESNFVTSTKFDKSAKYFSSEIKASKDGNELLNIVYVDNNYEKYLKKSSLSEKFTRFDADEINLELFDAEKNIYIGNVLKTEFLKVLYDEKFEIGSETINVNGKSIETKFSNYYFTGNEFSTLLDNIITGLEQNTTTVSYLADLYGVRSSAVRAKLESLKTGLNIEEELYYCFSAYTKDTTDETVRLKLSTYTDLDNSNEQEIFNYSKDGNYSYLVYFASDGAFMIEGNIREELKYTVSSDDEIIRITSLFKDERKSGTIEIIDISSDTTTTKGNYNYVINKNSSGLASMSITLSLESVLDNETATIDINSSLLISANASIDKIDTTSYEWATSSDIKTRKEFIDEFLDMLLSSNIEY